MQFSLGHLSATQPTWGGRAEVHPHTLVGVTWALCVQPWLRLLVVVTRQIALPQYQALLVIGHTSGLAPHHSEFHLAFATTDISRVYL